MKGIFMLQGTSCRAVVFLSLFLCGGCAFTPAPVVIAEKPGQEQMASNGLKVAVVVRDSRIPIVQQAHLCGIKRNSYMIPTSFAFIIHPETFDTIVAYHVKNILERAGYDVVAALPAVPEQLNPQHLTAPPCDNSTALSARNELAKDHAPKEVKEGGELEVTDITTAEAVDDPESWTGLHNLDEVDAILDIKITSLNSDGLQAFFFVSVQGWCKMKTTVCDPAKSARTVLWGKAYSGFGTSGPRAVITDDCYTMALNMAYWIMLDGFEKKVRSDEFQNMIRNTRKSYSWKDSP
jgi:hypothetical protein